MDKNIYPAGWNDKRVRKVIDDIEARTEEETIAEDEAAFGQDTRGFSFPLRPFDRLRDHRGRENGELRRSHPSVCFEWTRGRVAYTGNSLWFRRIGVMANSITYSRAKAELASLCDEVIATREPVIIRQDNADDVALLPADELSGLLETIHLLRSLRNAQRLFAALDRARTEECPPSSVADLRRQL